MCATVLIVDDSWIARLKLGEMVKSAGHTVIEAASGKEGLERIESDRPDVILLDLLMPEMTGHEVLRELNNRSVKTPVIVITADIQETTRKDCLEEGAAEVVNKPPKRELLLETITNFLSRQI